MTTLFSGRGVTIDYDFARFGSKSYAINKITSTDIKTVNPLGVFGCGGILIALFFAFSAIGGFTAGWIIALLVGAAAVYMMSKQAHSLVLVSSAQEVRVFQDKNQSVVIEMKEAVERAMARSNSDR